MRKMLGAVLILLASVYGAYLLLLRQRERRNKNNPTYHR